MKINIYQLYHPIYLPDYEKYLEPGMIPRLNREPELNKNPLRENLDIIDVYYNESLHNVDYIGFVSWRFKEKTGLTFNDIIRQLDENDIYSLIPSQKPLHHYQESYPGMQEICVFFDSKKILPIKSQGYNGPQSYCNFWIMSNKRFREYVPKWLLPCYELAQKHPELLQYIYPNHRGQPYPTLVFFFEGLFSLFLYDKKFKYIK